MVKPQMHDSISEKRKAFDLAKVQYSGKLEKESIRNELRILEEHVFPLGINTPPIPVSVSSAGDTICIYPLAGAKISLDKLLFVKCSLIRVFMEDTEKKWVFVNITHTSSGKSHLFEIYKDPCLE